MPYPDDLIPYSTFVKSDRKIRWHSFLGAFGFYFSRKEKTFVFNTHGDSISSTRALAFIRGLKSGGFLE
jgi:hypothetical protein